MVGSDWLVGLFSLASKVEGRQGGRETHTHREREREPYYAVGSAKPITHSHHARTHATICRVFPGLGSESEDLSGRCFGCWLVV